MTPLDDELDTYLNRASAPPAGFTDRVMARVANTPQLSPRVFGLEWLPVAPTVPWWARVALEPACILATLLVSALLWRGSALVTLAATGAAQVAAWATATMANAPAGPWSNPTVVTCIVLAAAPLSVMGSREIYRLSAALVGPRHVRLRPH